MHLRRSRVEQAYDLLLPMLEASPDDPELHAVYGSLMAQAGRHADAATAFVFGDGTQWYARSGMRQHASSLSAMGLIEEAIQVRALSRLNPRRDESSDIITFAAMVDDYRRARRWEDGQEALDELFSLSDGPKAWCAAVWFYTDQGRWDEAFWAAWHASQVSDPLECRLARANLYLQMGDLDGAEAILQESKKHRIRHLVMGSLLAELERLRGDPAEAVRIIRLRRYSDTMHIDLRAAEVRALIDLQEYDEAKDVLDQIRSYHLAPQYQDLVGALAAAQAAAGLSDQ